MRRKFIIKLEGGLGNQLFQYAHAVALASAYGGEIVFDKHAFNEKQIRACALENYVLNDYTRTRINIVEKAVVFFYLVLARVVRKGKFAKTEIAYRKLCKAGLYNQYQVRWFDSLVKPQVRVNYVMGNWISERFFDVATEDVKSALYYKNALPTKCDAIRREIANCESVCVHIRLGDYLSPQWKDKLFVCTPDYYRQAIEVVKHKVANPHFYIFSNRHKDFEMIKQEYDLGDVTYVDMGNSDVEDMELMRSCKHFIMSNSTYSWWGQYLAESPNKVVVAPSRFNNYPQWDMSDIYQDNWIIIEV